MSGTQSEIVGEKANRENQLLFSDKPEMTKIAGIISL